jgi:hypothetical protein
LLVFVASAASAGADLAASMLPFGMSRRFVNGLNTALILAALGYGFYAAMTDSGPYRWLTERQTAWFGGHYPMLTVLALFIAGLLAVGLVSAIGSRIVRDDVRDGASVSNRTGMLLVLLAGLAFAAGAVGLGWLAADTSAKPVIYAPFDLGRHEVPRGTHVELVGIEQASLRLSVQQGTTVTTYVPFTAPDWQPDQPVTYFLVNGAASPSPAPTPFGAAPPRVTTVQRRGALVEDGLPSVARAGFEKHGIKLAEPVFVIDASAGAAILRLVMGAGICGALALALLLAFFVERAQARRRARPIRS